MKEILRIQHGLQNDFPEEALFDYNLELYEGDILYIQGNRGDGLRTLIKVLAGDIPLKSGTIYLWDKKTEDYSRNTAMQYRLCMITGETDMVMNMSVTDNLEAVHPVRSPLQLYISYLKQRQVQRYLDAYGVHISAGDAVFHLNRFEQMELSIIKAQMHGARLIGLDMTDNRYEGKEAEKIVSLIRKANEEGISFLIFSESYSMFSEIANRIQLLAEGREQKEWYRPGDDRERIRKRLRQDIYGKRMTSAGFRGDKENGLLGLYDDEWENREEIWEYLRAVKEYNPEIWKQYIDAELPGEKEQGTAVFVPMEAAKLLLSNLSLADNIILSVPERVCGSKYGIIKKSIKDNIVRGFYERFQIENSVNRVEELDLVHRKILAIYRWELAKPKVIFLENPYNGLMVDEKKIMADYLWELENKKIRVILLSGSIENLKETCGKILVTKNGKSAKITTI
ncbi:MAG: ATP-binding cassette domain-containing protein [Lachnospiraceae bacterium]|nr:ATP-binding cassette domain-containing protein [Lachnospiraceae bacterium]